MHGTHLLARFYVEPSHPPPGQPLWWHVYRVRWADGQEQELVD